MASATDILPPLTLEELVTLFRQEVDDLPGDTVSDVNWKNDDTGLLWSNQEAVRYANEAQIEFCYRQPILDRTTQTTLTQLAFNQGVQSAAYSTRILSIKRAKWVGASGDEQVLHKRTEQWMDDHHPNTWQLEGNATMEGVPRYYVEDAARRTIMLYPLPPENGVVHLTVWRLPFKYMSWSRRHLDAPEIDEQHHLDLIDYMVYLAYLKRDSETENKDLAEQALARFTLKVGDRPSARLLRVRRQERNYPRRARGVYF